MKYSSTALALLALILPAGCDVGLFMVLPAATANAPTRVEVIEGVPFAQPDGRFLRADFLRAEPQHETGPLVILVHGGSWTWGDRSHLWAFAYDLAANGYPSATIDYRLVDDETVFPAPVADVLAAVRFFKTNASLYGIDPDRIVLLGVSAGGNLALLAGLAADASVFDEALPAEPAGVAAVVNLFGPTDLTVDAATAAPWQVERVEKYLGVPLDMAGELRAKASPVSYVRADGPVVLTIHGDADTVVPVSQARLLTEALETAGQAHEYLEVAGMGHLDGAIWATPTAQSYRSTLLGFLAGAVGP